MPDPFSDDTIVEDESLSVEDLVGEGKKYKDVNELAKAYANADGYIATLKAEKFELDAERKVLRDLVEARKENKSDDPPNQQQDRNLNTPDPAPKKEEVDLGERVRQELTSARETERRTANINEAAERLSGHYGSPAKAQEAIRTRASELGLGFDWLRDVAADSPKAFFEMMGVNARPNSTPSYNNEFNSNRDTSGKKDFSYFESIRKANPKLYYDRSTQKQMFDAARELGDKFYAP